MCAVNWAPGTLLADDDGSVFFVVARPGVSAVDADGNCWSLGSIEGARPLVVLDPEDRDQMVTLHETLSGTGNFTWHGWPMLLRDVLTRYAKAQSKPAKPPEPRGLGAVVEDAEGRPWVRFKTAEIRPWRLNYPGAPCTYFRDIDAVKVLSEGVTP